MELRRYMAREWMKLNRRGTSEYVAGVDNFLEFAFANSSASENFDSEMTIQCPCTDCANVYYKTRNEFRFHLLNKGFLQSYTVWYRHGEQVENFTSGTGGTLEHDNFIGESILDMLQEVCGVAGMGLMGNNEREILEPDARHPETQPHTQQPQTQQPETQPPETQPPTIEATRFYRLLEDYNETLTVGGEKISKLVYLMKLLHLKCLNHWTDTSFTQLLKFQNDTLGCNLPKSYDACRKLLRDLGLDYIRIDACQNDCIIYWREHANAQQCPKCDSSRWKTEGKNVPNKILHYFPLKPRLQRLFMSSKTTKEMRWHKEENSDDDGIMRHPSDSPAWKSFDKDFETFAKDPRSVRLGLAADGFQPFNNFGGTSHSIWPVALVPYNLPPWMCMKPPYILLTLLIDGPSSPGMNLDVYLQPLIEELKELWVEGAVTYDAHSKESFVMHASLLWTISDFPAYADLSGWSTKGFHACPSCHKEPGSLPIKNRISYMRHRRWLHTKHKWRKIPHLFDNTVEKDSAPVPLTGDDVLQHCSQFTQVPFGNNGTPNWNDTNSLFGWRKRSIFFELPYWRKLKLRHNLDVMHTEKNVSENILSTVMNIKGKTKDNIKARLDLVKMGIREDLHPIVDDDKVRTPIACYTLGVKEKSAFCEMLQSIKTPDGYCSNISRCVKDNGQKMSGMKSHDHHIFLEQLLPVAIRGLLPSEVCEPLIELSTFFKNLCSKNLTMKDLDDMEKKIPFTLCKLEMIFPPSFFSVMMHLVIHLVAEAKIGGPVRYRWMYPVERYLRTLKSYVRNKARPEGSIARGYLADECLTFCSRYMEDMTTKFNLKSRNDDTEMPHTADPMKETSNAASLENEMHSAADLENEICRPVEPEIFKCTGRPLGKANPQHLSWRELEQVHLYVLQNCDDLSELVKEHKNELLAENPSPRTIERRHKSQFSDWARTRVERLYEEKSVHEDLYHLVCGPLRTVRRYTSYVVNGFRFHTLDRQAHRKTQNSGIMVRGDNESNREYYGVLRDIFELQYPGENSVFAFKCDWYDVLHEGRGYKVDEFGIPTLCSRRHLSTDEPFVLDSQAEQVFYVAESRDKEWLVVIKTEPRDLYNMPDKEVDEDFIDQISEEPVQQEAVSKPGRQRNLLGNVESLSLATNHFTVERGDDAVKWMTKELQKIKNPQQGKPKKRRMTDTNLDDFIVDDDIEI